MILIRLMLDTLPRSTIHHTDSYGLSPPIGFVRIHVVISPSTALLALNPESVVDCEAFFLSDRFSFGIKIHRLIKHQTCLQRFAIVVQCILPSLTIFHQYLLRHSHKVRGITPQQWHSRLKRRKRKVGFSNPSRERP